LQPLTCPVCRARKQTENVCRRCSADLELLQRALAALEAAKAELCAARQFGDQTRIQSARERLGWLSPQANQDPQAVAESRRT